MLTHPLIIIGSARKDSDTLTLVKKLFPAMDYDSADLLDHKIHPYNYPEIYPEDDDFMDLVASMLDHKVIVFATPVYWYAMSGTMKILFDRFSDLVGSKKTTSRKLKNRHVFLAAVGAQQKLPDGFEVPFRETSGYLGMHFGGTYYCPLSRLDSPLQDAKEFISAVRNISHRHP